MLSSTTAPSFKFQWILRYMISMTLCYLIISLMTYVQLVTENRVIQAEDSLQPLKDIGHASGFDLRKHRKVVDLVLIPLYGLIFLYMVLFMYGRLRVLGLRITWHVFFIYVLRTLALAFTTMKGPTHYKCKQDVVPEKDMAFKSFFGLFSGTFHCNDMMFSGHTSITVALSLVVLISYSGNVRFKLLEMGFKVVVFLMMCAELLLIVWTRRHYTMDVVVGVIVSLSLVGVYYGTLLSAMVHQSLSSSKLSHDLKKIRAPLVFGSFPFIFKLIRWMDGADLIEKEVNENDNQEFILGLLPVQNSRNDKCMIA